MSRSRSQSPAAALRAVPGVAGPFGWSLLARLPGLMTPLAVVVVVQQERGSYTIAGIASAVFAAGTAVGSPLLGRVIQHLGQSRVVMAASSACAAALVAVAIGERLGQPVPLLLVLIGLAGLLLPPFTAAMRAVWASLASGTAARDAGYALDAVVTELLFVVGPLIVSATLLLGGGVVPLLISAALVAVGGLGYSRSAPVRAFGPAALADPGGADPVAGSHGPGVLTRPGVPAGLIVGTLTAATMGLIDTALLAISADKLGSSSLIGVLIACIVAGSVVGGLVFGSRAWRTSLNRQSALSQLALALLLLPVVGALLLPAGSLPALLVTLVLFGTMLAPGLILQQAVLDARAPAEHRLFLQACLVGANTAGVAVGTAVGGVAVDAMGGPRALACALPPVFLAAATAIRATRIPSLVPSPVPGSAPSPRPESTVSDGETLPDVTVM